ncbi:MAG: response regulator [Patescibacteria group bacterium]|nr:response regulator [Patescibacteria group bacterium]
MDNKRILIVEDDDSLRHIMHDNLAQAGYEVLTAPDGEEGLKQALEGKPDVILLDIMMPKVDGITMLKNYREKVPDSQVPVIMLSNLGEVKQVSDALALGAKDYWVKSSFGIGEIVDRVREKLK